MDCRRNIVDFFFLALSFIVLLTFVVLLSSTNFTGPIQNPAAIAFKDASKGKSHPDWEMVPKNILKHKSPVTNELCHKWNFAQMPIATYNPSLNCGDDCGFRVSILAMNATIKTTNTGGAALGTPEARNVFFPGDQNSNNAFVTFFGTESQVNAYLANTSVCPVAIGNESDIDL